MVYGTCYVPRAQEQKLRDMGCMDSKMLTGELLRLHDSGYNRPTGRFIESPITENRPPITEHENKKKKPFSVAIQRVSVTFCLRSCTPPPIPRRPFAAGGSPFCRHLGSPSLNSSDANTISIQFLTIPPWASSRA